MFARSLRATACFIPQTELGGSVTSSGSVALTRTGRIDRPATRGEHDAKDEGAARKALKRLRYPLDVILRCVRWYVAYSLSLRNLEEIMAERGSEVDHSNV